MAVSKPSLRCPSFSDLGKRERESACDSSSHFQWLLQAQKSDLLFLFIFIFSHWVSEKNRKRRRRRRGAKNMMKIDKKGLIICAVVGFLGLVSAVLGFVAEAKRIKASQVIEVSPGVCSYPRSPAYALGITAAFSLLVAHIIIDFASGCICCRRNPYTSTAHWTLGLVCIVIFWFTFTVAFFLLLGAAALNDQHGAENVYFNYYYCYVVKPGVFAVAAVLSLASVAFGILYYVSISSGKSVNYPMSGPIGPNQSVIAMGQPQVPPTSSDPVFVHEDTYIRRQFT